MKWVLALAPILVGAGLIAALVLSRQQTQELAAMMYQDGIAALAGFQVLEGRLGCQGRVFSGQRVTDALAALIVCADGQRASDEDAMRELAERMKCPVIAMVMRGEPRWRTLHMLAGCAHATIERRLEEQQAQLKVLDRRVRAWRTRALAAERRLE